MKNILTLLALVLSLGTIIYLYLQLSTSQQELALAQRHITDCEQVTFQLQNQLTQQSREKAAKAGQPLPGEQE
ncbi:hypothetical protein F0P96_03385 [Hymenobacter busanensis]|uniref:Uncharacterized protein n=1 Tax=Hymenobacter busanensis TaxID=2607656 RepID=A0A7L4ZUT3_9BACT|nr:hypothetical protein [Hymenobacter busanensis]KAA9339670.1 hypothetical protein F0P96_03385 [Hymenobacter busanensis]QHJ06575.1 hypothetical protein GUY19_04365 [Hymenobacter busanensis]